MKKINWAGVSDVREFDRLGPGGYVCIIAAAQDFPDKEYLKIEYDIAEGQYKGYFHDLNAAVGFWAGNFIKSYSEKAQPFFKGMLTAVKESNPGWVFADDERRLVGTKVGLVLGEEDYYNQKGEKKTRLFVDRVTSIATIRAGDFVVPEKKAAKENSTGTTVRDAMYGGSFRPMQESGGPPAFGDEDVPF